MVSQRKEQEDPALNRPKRTAQGYQGAGHKAQGKIQVWKTRMYFAPHGDHVFPLPSRDFPAVRHPGQVRQSGTRALLNFPEGTLFYRASRDPDEFIILNSNWIPDLARQRRTRPE
jgi:hypothetical protein